jgi:hypothetical protein
VNTIMKVVQELGSILANWVIVCLSRMTLLHGVNSGNETGKFQIFKLSSVLILGDISQLIPSLHKLNRVPRSMER